MALRIELVERFLDITQAKIDECEKMGLPVPETYSYRRIYVRLADIFAPKEIPGKKSHCLIEFYDCSTMIVKGKYDDICITINDLENSEIEEDDLTL
jgi:hypothetical protein